jgi:hypothetical protein
MPAAMLSSVFVVVRGLFVARVDVIVGTMLP